MDGELIPIEKREIVHGEMIETVNLRDLWSMLKSKQKYADWIKNRIAQWKFIEGTDFGVHKFRNTNNAAVIEYFGSLEMAKELGMLEDNDEGRMIRRWFIDREKKLANVEQQPMDMVALLNDPVQLRVLLLGQTEKLLALNLVVEEQKPKVEALKRISDCQIGEMTITEAAKVLKVGPKKLFDWMRANQWIYPSKRRNVANQDKIRRGFLKEDVYVQSIPGQEDRLGPTILVTPLGLAELSKIFAKKSGELPFDA